MPESELSKATHENKDKQAAADSKQKEEERRKKEKAQWERILAEYYSGSKKDESIKGGHPGFVSIDDQAPNNQGLCLQNTASTTGLLKDGSYKSLIEKKGVAREITVKNGSITSTPKPKNLAEYEESCWEMMMFLKQKGGKSTITVDFPNSKDITEARIKKILEAAKRAGVSVNFGPGIRKFLESKETNIEHGYFKRVLRNEKEHPLTRKLSEKARKKREDGIYAILNAHNKGLEKNSLEERSKIQDFHYEKYDRTLNSTNPKKVATKEAAEEAIKTELGKPTVAENVKALEKQYDLLERQLATIENARAHLKLDLDYYNSRLPSPENQPYTQQEQETIKTLANNRQKTQDLIESLEQNYQDVKLRRDACHSSINKLQEELGSAGDDSKKKFDNEANIERLTKLQERHDGMDTAVNMLPKDISSLKGMHGRVYDNIPAAPAPIQTRRFT